MRARLIMRSCDGRFSQFLTEGRSFGPHGQDLVIADSIENYNDELSKELTQLTVTANLHMRAIGFKPFIAPAYSSRRDLPDSDDGAANGTAVPYSWAASSWA